MASDGLLSTLWEFRIVKYAGAAFLASAVLLGFVLIQWTIGTLRPKAFPPGPPITPGLGNLLQMPMTKPYLVFDKWFKQYGDIIGLKIGTGNMVVINNPEIVLELFDRRGAIYSARPPNHILNHHVFPLEEDKAIAVLQYDDYYKHWRKSLNYILNPAGLKRVMPILESEATNFARLCLAGNKDGQKGYIRNLEFWAIAGPLAITCGRRMDDLPEDYTETFVANQNGVMNLIIPGASPPVDVFPFLKYLPESFGASWKKAARAVHASQLADRLMYLRHGKDQAARIKRDPGSVGLPCLVAKILAEQEANPTAKSRFTDTELAHLGASIGGAAVDTTAATIKSLLLLLASHPDVLRKAQAEVDRVGNGAPPRAEDLEKLVFLRACISETIRFRPTTASALPHTLEKDDTYNGYFFPKGTTFIANAWTLSHNEADFENPGQWIPERFLANAYGLRPERYATQLKAAGKEDALVERDNASSQPATLGTRRALYAFGSGRRMCPGVDFAFTTLLLVMGKVLWAYDVVPPPGVTIDTDIETGYDDGLVTEPKNPEVLFKLRDGKREAGIMEDYERTQAIARNLIP